MATKTTTSARKSKDGSTKHASRRAPSTATPNKNRTTNTRQTRSHSTTVTHGTKRGGKRSTPTPPAASIAAAPKVLRTAERRENTLRKALKRQKKSLDQLKKAATAHRGTVKSLKTDLRKVRKNRQAVSSNL